MGFPSKKPESNTVIPVAADIKSRREFLQDLPNKVRNIVRGVDLALINEAIVAISEGKATINGKSPKSRVEMYILIASYFTTVRTPLHMFFEGAENIEKKYTVVIKYKDQPVTIEFPSKPIVN